MYILISLIALFIGAIVLGKILNKDYSISLSNEEISIKKLPNRRIHMAIVLGLMFNFVLAISLGSLYSWNWSLLILIPVFCISGYGIKILITDYKNVKNTRINFKENKLFYGDEEYTLNSIEHLEYEASTKGSSSNRHYILRAKIKKGKTIELLNEKKKEQLVMVKDILTKQLDLNTIEIPQ